jgi:hypothetical protein
LKEGAGAVFALRLFHFRASLGEPNARSGFVAGPTGLMAFFGRRRVADARCKNSTPAPFHHDAGGLAIEVSLKRHMLELATILSSHALLGRFLPRLGLLLGGPLFCPPADLARALTRKQDTRSLFRDFLD